MPTDFVALSLRWPRGEQHKIAIVGFGLLMFRLVLRMEAFGNCPTAKDGRDDNKNMAYFVEAGIAPYERTTVGWGTINVTKDIRRMTQNMVTISRCLERNDPACAEHWQHWRFGEDVCCYNLRLKDMMWTPLFRAQPPFGCPMSKGMYHQQNVTINLEKLWTAGFNLGDAINKLYKVKMEIDADRSRFMDACFEFTVTRMRVR